MRPEQMAISAPEFPPDTSWINASFVRLGTLLGRNVMLVWFWDYCSLNSLRALPYVREWNHRYRDCGLRVTGIHSPQFEFGKERHLVAEAAGQLGINFPVAPDSDYTIWRLYGTEVWPSLYLWDRRGVLRHYHFGEGAYRETEEMIQQLLREIEEKLQLPEPMAPLRATDAPDALVRVPTPHRYLEEDRSARQVAAGDELTVRYSGAGAAAVLDGHARIEVLLDGESIQDLKLDGPRLYELVETERHEQHALTLRFDGEARAYAFSFAPGPI